MDLFPIKWTSNHSDSSINCIEQINEVLGRRLELGTSPKFTGFKRARVIVAQAYIIIKLIMNWLAGWIAGAINETQLIIPYIIDLGRC